MSNAEKLVAAIQSQYRLDGDTLIRIRTGLPVVGALRKDNGYRQVSVTVAPRRYHSVLLHRLKFFLKHGYMPLTVDHEDRHKDNNEMANLRDATFSQQGHNRKRPTRDLPRGVYKNRNKFQAMSRNATGRVHLGMFSTPEEASHVVEAYLKERYGKHYVAP